MTDLAGQRRHRQAAAFEALDDDTRALISGLAGQFRAAEAEQDRPDAYRAGLMTFIASEVLDLFGMLVE